MSTLKKLLLASIILLIVMLCAATLEWCVRSCKDREQNQQYQYRPLQHQADDVEVVEITN